MVHVLKKSKGNYKVDKFLTEYTKRDLDYEAKKASHECGFKLTKWTIIFNRKDQAFLRAYGVREETGKETFCNIAI